MRSVVKVLTCRLAILDAIESFAKTSKPPLNTACMSTVPGLSKSIRKRTLKSSATFRKSFVTALSE